MDLFFDDHKKQHLPYPYAFSLLTKIRNVVLVSVSVPWCLWPCRAAAPSG